MPAAPARSRWGAFVAGRRAAWGLAAVAWLVYSAYALARHRQHLTAGYDLGIFHQVVHAYSRFRAPVVPLKGLGYNIYGDHFHPAVALLAPLYWVWDDPRMLLVAQAGLAAVSVVPVHAYVRRHWPARAAFATSVGYVFFWPVQKLVDFDVHEIAFAVPLLALALDALDRRSDRRLLLAGLALLLVREDMGAVVLVLGVLRLWRRPRWPAAVLLVTGPLMLWFTTRVVLPHFNPTGEFAYWTYTQLGPDAPRALLFMVTHPLQTLTIFLTPFMKVRTLLWLFVPLLLLPLRSPWVLLSAPLLAQRFFSTRALLWEPGYHYSAPLAPILVMAAVDGARRLAWPRLRRLLPTVLCAVMAFSVLTYNGIWPLSRLVYGVALRTTERMRQQEAIAALVPPGTCVGADDRVVPMLVTRNVVAQATPHGGWADYLIFDRGAKDPGYLLPPTAQSRVLARGAGYHPIAVVGKLELWQAPRQVHPRPECRP